MIGQTISHYKILEELGGGGMGVVYKAEDTKLDRPVALKFLPHDLTRDPEAKKRFIHEAKAASALQHHNICTIHEIDETNDGRMFISMDCYEGETLKERIARGSLPVDEALDIASQVVEGLAKAHEAGMVHRDIKPANIMITSDGIVKILDFGLAKLAGQTRVTKTGTTVGTVAYMSPEQARGEAVDARSDVFSLGAVIYEMLTSELPFKGDHEAAVMYGIMHNEPERLATYRNDLPEQLQQIIDKALAKDLTNRHENASDLLRDLAPWRPVRAAVTSGSSLSPPKMKLKHIIAISVMVVVVVAIAFIVGKQRLSAPSTDDLSLAIVDFRDLLAPEDPLASAEITTLLHVGLVESSPMRVVSPDYLHDLRRRSFGSARGPIEEGQVLEVARDCGSSLFLSGRIKRGDYVTWRLVDTHSGKSLAARRVDGDDLAMLADQIIAEVLPVLARESGVDVLDSPPSVSTLTTNSQEAHMHYIAGVLDLQESRLKDAIRELRYALELDSTFALALFQLSRAQFVSGDRGEPLRDLAEKAWQLRVRLGIKDRLRLEAWRQHLDWRVTDAIATYRELLARWPDDREVLSDLGGILSYFWYSSEAKEVTGYALDIYPDDRVFLGIYWISLLMTGKNQEALDIARGHTARHPELANAWNWLGLSYLHKGLADSAEAAYRRSLELNPQLPSSQIGIGSCAYSRGDLQRAIKIYERVLNRKDLLPGQRVSNLTYSAMGLSLALFYAEAGRFKEALGLFEEARKYTSDIEEIARMERNRAYLLLRAGEAREVLDAAKDLSKHTDSRYALYEAVELRAMALAALDSLEAARSASVGLESLEDSMGRHAVLMASKVNAEIALTEGNPQEALAALHEMGEAPLCGHGFFSIEYWEALARAHRMAGHHNEALKAHQEILLLHGGHALSHYELGKIYQEIGRSTEATKEFTEFLEMWSEADEGMPQVEDAKARLAALGKANP